MSAENNADAVTESNPQEESSITMLDVLEQEKELDDEYAAVLGASDEKCCTYATGAVQRQALYSCLTCNPESRNDLSKCAGICLACSYRCHENHELIELYTKRNFRCDCPTTRAGGKRCVLNPQLDAKQAPNETNLYNQNFQGLYCKCKRPYPDPERTTEELMLQCAVCEDWYHLQHLDTPAGAAKLLDMASEVICDICMDKHAFLRDYTGLALSAVDLNESTLNVTANGDISVCVDDDNKLKSDLDKSIADIMNINGGAAAAIDEQQKAAECADTDDVGASPKRKRQKLDVDAVNEQKEQYLKPQRPAGCRRPIPKQEQIERGATFWGVDWRAELCKCAACLQLYKDQQVEFLKDLDDSAKTYEERGMKRASENSTYEQGIRALASIDRTKQIDAITEYNRMKDKLKDYLRTFVDNKKVVTEADINRFFEEMRNENNVQLGQPFFCR